MHHYSTAHIAAIHHAIFMQHVVLEVGFYLCMMLLSLIACGVFVSLVKDLKQYVRLQ